MHGSIALPRHTVRAGTPRGAGGDFHKAAPRFVSSTSHFVTPRVPASRAGEQCRADASGAAIAPRQRSSISTNHAWIECRDYHQAKRVTVDLSSPTNGTAVEMCELKEAAILAHPTDCLDRSCQTRAPPDLR